MDDSIVSDVTLDSTVTEEESAVCDVTLDTTCEESVCDVTLDSSINSQGQLDDGLHFYSAPIKKATSISVEDGKIFSSS